MLIAFNASFLSLVWRAIVLRVQGEVFPLLLVPSIRSLLFILSSCFWNNCSACVLFNASHLTRIPPEIGKRNVFWSVWARIKCESYMSVYWSVELADLLRKQVRRLTWTLQWYFGVSSTMLKVFIFKVRFTNLEKYHEAAWHHLGTLAEFGINFGSR